MIRALVLVSALLISFEAQAFQVSCEDVRAYVAQYGKAAAIVFAIKNGATWQQIRDARKCLRS